MRDGRTYRFAGILDGVRMQNGDVEKVDNEGAVQDDNQTTQTVQRAAISAAVGAIIGAMAGGGKGYSHRSHHRRRRWCRLGYVQGLVTRT